jgi:hypothetical protein
VPFLPDLGTQELIMSAHRFLTSCLGLGTMAAALMLSAETAPAQAPAKKPNIVFMLADNLGYSDGAASFVALPPRASTGLPAKARAYSTSTSKRNARHLGRRS